MGFLLTIAITLFTAAAAHLSAAATPPAEATVHPGEARPPNEVDSMEARPRSRRPGDRLAEARARLATTPDGPAREVDRWAIRLATDRRASQAALARYSIYRPLIHDALRRHDLPIDLAFVPWVESEWRSDTASVAGADGMWQFMATTARGYGLEVSEFVDERRDPVRATEAAARHLRDLYRVTKDWHTALAAYNAGLGRAERLRGTTFWRGRDALPPETRAYVPRVLAAARVGRDPAAWGLEPTIAAPLRFREVWLAGGIRLDSAAIRLGVPTSDLLKLNPHLVRRVTPPGRRWPVRVPVTPPARTPTPHP